jgi:hypothetical protein
MWTPTHIVDATGADVDAHLHAETITRAPSRIPRLSPGTSCRERSGFPHATSRVKPK